MPLVQFPSDIHPNQVDDFPEGSERSCKGALHIRPSSTKVLTKDELDHLQKAHKPLVAKAHVVREDITPQSEGAAKDKAKLKETAKAETAKASSPAPKPEWTPSAPMDALDGDDKDKAKGKKKPKDK